MTTTASSKPTHTIKDRVQLPFQFDIAKMQAEMEALDFNTFLYYNVLPLRAPAHIVDPSIPMPPPAEDFADGSWTEWLDTGALKKSPYLMSIVDTFRKHTKVTLVRLLRLEGGAVVKEHTDPTLGLEVHKSVIRLTVPIVGNDKVEFFLNNTIVPMNLGECWYLRLTDPHRVVNGGTSQRINLTIDMIPNEWVQSLILDNQ
ncbi:MAG: aspartyl/asparaginyl beta-hydroxylase domain-containing protein [Chitinophagales bacterium]